MKSSSLFPILYPLVHSYHDFLDAIASLYLGYGSQSVSNSVRIISLLFQLKPMLDVIASISSVK